MSKTEQVIDTLRTYAQVERAQKSAKYLQTQEGGYGYPDRFLGVTNPQVRMVVKQYLQLSVYEITQLFCHEYHEVRLFATIIMNEQYKRNKLLGDTFFQIYYQNISQMNNWDLVDTLGPHMIGPYLYSHQRNDMVWELAHSPNLFEQRMAVIAQFAWIRAGETTLLYELAIHFLDHTHDLMHKAVGWLLREAGKFNREELYIFLDRYGKQMPRTMLRYAIEHFEEPIRKQYLLKTK